MPAKTDPGAAAKATIYQYTKINELLPGASLNFWGRVVLYKDPKPTRGADWIMTLIVTDDSVPKGPSDSSASPDGLAINIFRADLAAFPKVKGPGDIVQFRHMRVQMYQASLQAISTNWSAFTVFSKDPLTGIWRADPPHPLSWEEKIILDRLVSEPPSLLPVSACSSPESKSAPSGSAKRPLLTFDQMKPGQYFDTVAEIVAICGGDQTQANLILCDYSENPLLDLEPTAFGLSEKLAFHLLYCTLWDNHCKKAAELKVGQIIRIANLHGRTAVNIVGRRELPSGKDDLGGLVATLHGEKTPSERIIVLGPHSEAFAELERRKARFWEQCTAQADATRVALSCPTRIGRENVPLTSIQTIRTFPRKNFQFSLKARVISHHPTEIREFTRRFCPKCRNSWPVTSLDNQQLSLQPSASQQSVSQHSTSQQSPPHTICPSCSTDVPIDSYTFMFCLTVDDGTGELALIFCYEDASKFLNGMQPVNLYANAKAYEYLAQVVGTLESLAAPAIFCIKSYQIRVPEQDGSDSGMRYRVNETFLNF